MEENRRNSIFSIGNSLIITKNSLNDTSEKNGGDFRGQVSESESEESSESNLSKFDKYLYTFLLCYANLTYVSLNSVFQINQVSIILN